MGLASHLWLYFPVPRAQGTFQKGQFLSFPRWKEFLICSSRREEKSQALLFRGNWWQKFRDLTGPCRLIDGLQFGKGKMAVVEPIKATTWRHTMKIFGSKQRVLRLHSLRLALVCGGNMPVVVHNQMALQRTTLAQIFSARQAPLPARNGCRS